MDKLPLLIARSDQIIFTLRALAAINLLVQVWLVVYFLRTITTETFTWVSAASILVLVISGAVNCWTIFSK